MSEQFTPVNPALSQAVRDLYAHAVEEFRAEGADIHSEAFLARFPFIFIAECNQDPAIGDLRERVLAAAFSDEFRARTEEAGRIFYADCTGGTTRSNFCSMIDDFLNYAVPRVMGLPDERERFDRLYTGFERDLLQEKFTLIVIALLENIWDHGCSFHPTGGVRLSWAWQSDGFPANVAFLRERLVPYLELKKAAHPIGGGRAVNEKKSFFMLEFEELRPKKEGAITDAYRRSEEITRKLVFALRLLSCAPVYSDYRGFRMLGHYSEPGLNFMNYPDEYVEGGLGQDLKQYAWELERLIPHALATPYTSIAVLDHKIEDALRRERRGAVEMQEAESKAAVDKLLDYFQALEAVVPIEGSYQIALYAAVLLGAASRDGATRAPEVFQFIKDMHTLRNAVVHGRLDKVLDGKVNTKNKLNVALLRNYVHELAILYLLNPDERGNRGLCPLAHRLALGEPAVVKTLYEPPPGR